MHRFGTSINPGIGYQQDKSGQCPDNPFPIALHLNSQLTDPKPTRTGIIDPFARFASPLNASIGGAAMEHDDHLLSDEEIAALAARIDRCIVLVGMMGVGKTTVGRKLAAALGLPFVDADEAIEQAAQLTIPEIFERHGEAEFRDGERRVIARLIGDGDTHPKVIATGGGAFCNAATRKLVLDRALAVWIDSDIAVLLDRVSRKDNRPLLKQGDPKEILTRLRAERQPFYAEAPIHITSGNVPHTRTVSQVLKEINQWL